MNELPPPCAGGCGRPVRPRGTTRDDYPKTRTWATKARGMCYTCYTNTPDLIRQPRPECCVKCERPLRGTKDTLKANPGTVRHVGNGICDSCRKGWTKQKRVPPANCLLCEYPLRSRRTPEHEAPGTKIHDAKGLCTGCRGAVRRGSAGPLLPGVTRSRVGENARKPKPATPELTDPIALRIRAERKARAEKAERLRQVRIQQEQARARFIASRRLVDA